MLHATSGLPPRTARFLSGKRFEPPRDFDFDSYIGSSFGVVAEPATCVRIRFAPSWTTYVRERSWHPSQKLEPLQDGGLELSMEVGGNAELRSWVLSFGSGAEVLEPRSLREEVARELGQAMARYDAPAPGGGGREQDPANH